MLAKFPRLAQWFMPARFQKSLNPAGLAAPALLLISAALAFAQVTTIEGDVKGPDGQLYKGAVIKLVRTDIKGTYQVKSDKKGHWFYTGLPLGTYNITCEIDGKAVDNVNGVHSKYGESTTIDFDASKAAAQTQALAKAAETGELSKEQERSLTPEQKAALEKQAKERSEAMKKNKELNDAFNAGMAAMDAKQYDAAVTNLAHASELDPTQAAVWNNLGSAYLAQADTKTGAERTAALDKTIETYKKAIEITPNSGALYNQLAIAYGKEKKIPEATEATNKAATLDPAMGAKAYYNMGANLVNGGQSEQAEGFFKKAIEADPNYADAHFQYGICMMAKASVDAKTGKITPPAGTAEEFQKYLQLKPDGQFAQPSKDMLTSLGQTIQTNYVNPDAPKKKKN
jgi:tetratricopeptide (TPR) repeat protein